MNVKFQRLRFMMTFWPCVHAALLLGALFRAPLATISQNLVLALVVLYLLPPLLCRALFLVFGKPEGSFPADSSEGLVWFASSQLQIIYLRFPFLEEALILMPRVYSLWLRLWGARIGKVVFWSPQVKLMDRPYLEVGSFAVIGFGARFTSHHLVPNESGVLELHIASPRVGARAVMGGESGLAPGAQVADGELLPATLGLAPHYIWKDGRRQRQQHGGS